MSVKRSRTWNPRRLDVRAFAQAGESLQGQVPLAQLDRLVQECVASEVADVGVHWQAHAEERSEAGGAKSIWARLVASATLPLTCQRCLGPVQVPLEVDRWYRFVEDEETAQAQDDDCEEDVLALEPRPDWLALVEDELIMALPLVPMHETCPSLLNVSLLPAEQEEGAPAERPNPFAVLARPAAKS